MPRWFNTAGPCRPEHHYMLPATRRLPEVRRLIEQEGYFVVHAPRQVGKTTALRSLAQELTSEGRYAAVLVSMEVGAAFPGDIGAAEAAILDDWRETAAQLPPELRLPPFSEAPPGRRIGAALAAWARSSPRPLVVFLDEIDSLRDEVLVSVLRQLRSGHSNRPQHFPASLALIGLRDVHSFFNIKARTLTLRKFTAEEVAELYQQHTSETGQRFEVEALTRAFELTHGQPWLVNALAKVAVEELVTDTTQPVRRTDIERAKVLLVERREPHLASLAERLCKPRIRAILEHMLAGTIPGTLPPDDVRFAVDLGLIRTNEAGAFEIANPIYKEVVVRELSFPSRAALPPLQLRSQGGHHSTSFRQA